MYRSSHVVIICVRPDWESWVGSVYTDYHIHTGHFKYVLILSSELVLLNMVVLKMNQFSMIFGRSQQTPVPRSEEHDQFRLNINRLSWEVSLNRVTFPSCGSHHNSNLLRTQIFTHQNTQVSASKKRHVTVTEIKTC